MERRNLDNLQPDDLLTPKEAAAKLSLSVSTLARWRQQGVAHAPYVTMGKRAIRYRYGDLVAYIQSQTSGGIETTTPQATG